MSRVIEAVNVRGAFCGATTLAAFMLLVGCNSGPNTYSVKGKVVVKGTNKSLAGGTVMFQSVANPELQASGGIEDDGTFELFSNQGKAGIPEGEYRIMVQPPPLETGQPKLIHDKFRSYDTSGLKRTIAAGDNNLTIEVEPPAAR
jgi:hypothetical protein